MKTLPDPRHYLPFSSNPLVVLAQQAVAQGSAMQGAAAAEALSVAIEQALRGRES